jgi:AdoMet-dependent rRNA methyltransferase SPB1
MFAPSSPTSTCILINHSYEQYTERRAETDARYKAKRARKEHEDGEWAGFSENDSSDEDEDIVEHEQSSDDETDDEQAPKSLVTKLDRQDVKGENGLSKRAALFFDQSIFADIDEEDGEGKALDSSETKDNDGTFRGFDDEEGQSETEDVCATGGSEEEDDKIEFVKDEPWDAEDEPMKNSRPDIDIITAEAMSLAQQLVTGEKTKHDEIDDGFNKWSFRDRDGLPEWFLDTEDKYAKPIKPITAAGAAAIEEKLRALNAGTKFHRVHTCTYVYM